jgi:diguanylate cyclase (GGDEF)-like protein
VVTASASVPGKILVVEDEPSLQAILKLQLERAGYTVQVAGNGEEGLKAVDAWTPDLILMDVMMPVMDGNEVCRRLKATNRTRQIPIIMLTARSEQEDRVAGLSQGANDYITKPYQQAELLCRVRNLLVWGRLQRDANPLTGLPGNISIESELAARLTSGEPFVFMYVDIDNFKAFNDFYSYQKGDQAIRLTALILQNAVDEYGSPGDFVGHVGGDDFALILGTAGAGEVGEEIVRQFDERIPTLYSKVDRARGYVQVVNRKGDLEQYPLMTLTLAAVSTEGREIEHVAQIPDIAAELKHFGKRQKQSIIVWDRRAA